MILQPSLDDIRHRARCRFSFRLPPLLDFLVVHPVAALVQPAQLILTFFWRVSVLREAGLEFAGCWEFKWGKTAHEQGTYPLLGTPGARITMINIGWVQQRGSRNWLNDKDKQAHFARNSRASVAFDRNPENAVGASRAPGTAAKTLDSHSTA